MAPAFRALVAPSRPRDIDAVEPRATELRRLPALIKVGIALPFVLLAYDYMRYASRGWFYLDDFIFIDKYHQSIRFGELLHPQGFGRFVSTNAYWNVAWQLFGTHASFYFALNFVVIVVTAALLGRLVAARYGSVVGVVAALLYAALPNVVEGYTWISNSQHLLAHLFCGLFFLLYFGTRRAGFTLRTVAVLEVVLVVALLSNQLASALALVPLVDLVVSRESRRDRARWVLLLLALITVVAFSLRTGHQSAGAYSTDLSVTTLVTNARYYFGGQLALFAGWLAVSVAGFVFAARRRDSLLASMFAAGVGFVVPFLALEFQRADHYPSLGLAFSLIAAWIAAYRLLARRAATLVPMIALTVALAVGAWGSAQFSDVLAHPVGADQRQLTAQMREITNRNGPSVVEYCFESPNTTEFHFGEQTKPVPTEWWSLGFGTSFKYFVDNSKAYEPISFPPKCDRVVHIDGSSLRE
jgi:hypothetical protein